MQDDEELRVSVTEFARKVSAFVDQASSHPMTLTRNGQPVAVLMDFAVYRKLSEMEEQAEDLYWTVVALRQDIEWRHSGQPTVPLKEVEARGRARD